MFLNLEREISFPSKSFKTKSGAAELTCTFDMVNCFPGFDHIKNEEGRHYLNVVSFALKDPVGLQSLDQHPPSLP